MEGIHPTVKGTKNFLQELDAKLHMIADDRFITDPKLYRGVKSIFRYGCLFCHAYLDLDATFLCQECCTKFGDSSLGPRDKTQSEATTPSVLEEVIMVDVVQDRQGLKRSTDTETHLVTPKKFAADKINGEEGELTDSEHENESPIKY